MTLSNVIGRGHFLPLALLASLMMQAVLATTSLAQPPPSAGSAVSLSPAQIALFETPHLANVTAPETLLYDYRRVGPDAFTDTIAVHVKEKNADGSKDVTVDYLTGAHQVPFPPLEHFHGNPLFMIVLEHDVNEMSRALGMSKAYLRNRVRDAFIAAPVNQTTSTVGGKTTPAREIVAIPFAHDDRFARIRSLQAKTYRFLLDEQVPGGIAEIRVDTPADDALHAPSLSEQITFAGVAP